MVFNSYEFIVLFLPAAVLVFGVTQFVAGWNAAFAVLAAISLVFYAQLGPELLGILLVSIVSNYVIGGLILRNRENKAQSLAILVFGILGNLAALGYFKYTNFLIDITNQLTGGGYSHLDIVLPIGISFFTFIQIGYLVDMHTGSVKEHSFTKYVTFASLFPCVTAGPLVLQREIFSQMENRQDSFFDPARIAAGLTMFTIGLFKKVVLADNIAIHSDRVFDGVSAGQHVDVLTAWAGALAYSFQLYFDFSGYSDMAIGLAAIFGLFLPLNFNSPFKAASISDFWQRWHMTMTRFFTNYVYAPLAIKGMRKAMADQYGGLNKYLVSAGGPIVITMVVAGIWHGSGWTFLLFGLLHGIAIAINNGWKFFRLPKIPTFAGWLMTMLVVVCGLVIFRSPDVATASDVLAAMFGFAGQSGTDVSQSIILDLADVFLALALFGTIVLACPNSQEILSNHWISTSPKPKDLETGTMDVSWRPRFGWGLAMAGVFFVSFTLIGGESSFLYYKF